MPSSGTIVEELNHVMSGREDRLRVLLGSLEDVVGTLDAQKADIIRALEAMNNLTATLNAERQTVTDALDATGPAIEVLADQHDELIDDALLAGPARRGGHPGHPGEQGDLIKSLEHLQAGAHEAQRGRRRAGAGAQPAGELPVPEEASDVVKGDYANTSIRAEISLDNFITGGGGDPPIEIPPIELPDPGEVLNDVQKCLQSGNIASNACKKVLADVDLLNRLKKQCKKDKYKANQVCVVLNQVPDLPLDELPDVIDDILDGVLGRSLTSWLGDGDADVRPPTPARCSEVHRDRAASGSG